MSESTTAPAPVTVKFIPRDAPTLPAGDYTVNVTQTLAANDQRLTAVSREGDDSFSASQAFTVAAPRFSLDASLVSAAFPPPGSLGDHSNVLPHVALSRSTLPWERTPREGDETATWLALLVFTEEEAREVTVSQVPKGDLEGQYGKLEGWEDGGENVTVLQVAREVLEPLMPTLADLHLSAHVREGDGDPRAFVMANRLPQAGGTTTVHLVSLENQFREDGELAWSDDEATVTLASLYRWEFACTDEPDFGGLLKALDLGADAGGGATLRLPDTGSDDADAWVRQGYVPLNHSWRQGGTLVSWYHGPLLPGARLLEDSHGEVQTVQEAWDALRPPEEGEDREPSPHDSPYELARACGFDLPALSADALVRWQPDTAMLDASYAAAWELGRLLALRDKTFSVGLYNWKRTVIRALKNQANQQIWTYLPLYGGTPPDAYVLPEYQKSWLRALGQLEGVPFSYLVPHESMLPRESLRFFRTDPLWIISLLDGAFSMGRTLASDAVHEMKADMSSLVPWSYEVSGILLRSQVVSGWPDLVVTGYDADGNEMTVLRQARLGDQVLLCLFSSELSGDLARVQLSLEPEALHFGLDAVDAEDGGTTWWKELRPLDTFKDTEVELPVSLTDARVLDLYALAGAMAVRMFGEGAALDAAQFGYQMVEGAEAVRFDRDDVFASAQETP